MRQSSQCRRNSLELRAAPSGNWLAQRKGRLLLSRISFGDLFRLVNVEFSRLRSQVDPSGEVLLFSQGGCPWKEHLFSLERELEVETTVKFVLYPDQSGNWRIQCVPAGLNTFQNRCYFLSAARRVSL